MFRISLEDRLPGADPTCLLALVTPEGVAAALPSASPLCCCCARSHTCICATQYQTRNKRGRKLENRLEGRWIQWSNGRLYLGLPCLSRLSTQFLWKSSITSSGVHMHAHVCLGACVLQSRWVERTEQAKERGEAGSCCFLCHASCNAQP